MKLLISSAFYLLLTTAAFANYDISVSCTIGKQTLKVERINNSISYAHLVSNQIVAQGPINEFNEGFEGQYLNAYFWGFQSTINNNKVVLGVAVPGLKKPTPGKYNGLSDLIAVSGAHVIDGNTTPCTVEIR